MSVTEHRPNPNLKLLCGDSNAVPYDSKITTSPDLEAVSPELEEITSGVDFEEEIVHGMTASYTEISFNAQLSDQNDSILEDTQNVSIIEDSNRSRYSDLFHDRPNKLMLNFEGATEIPDGPHSYKGVRIFDQLNGTVTQEGEMVLFVAEDLEKKIKLSSPISKREELIPLESSGPPWLYRKSLVNQLPAFHSSILNDLEIEVSQIATSVDTLTENLAGILHSVSALTVDCLEIYRDVVCKTCDAVDLNIKSTYQLMAKCEELSKSMKPIYKFSEHVKEIKHFLDLFESSIN